MHLQVKGQALRYGKAVPVNIDFDTCSQVDIVSYAWAKKMDLKPYIKKCPQLLATAGRSELSVRGAFWVRYILQDDNGVRREFYKPFLAIDRYQESEDAPLLVSNHTLEEMGINLELRPQRTTWRFALDRHKPFVKVDSAKRFRRRLQKNPKIYALVACNHLIASASQTKENAELPDRLKDFTDVFSPVNAATLAPNREDVDLAIDVQPGSQPPYGPLYPLSPAELEVLRQYLQENLEKGFIRYSKSPAGSPILFVPKKDGTLRLCVDYRGLNAVTIKNRYPLPLISEIMDRVSGATCFSKIDLKDAYYRIRIKPGDEWKTAFRTRYGHFEYLVVPFGLTNAPAAFQSYINQALRGLVDDFCIVYLDDILVFSRTEQEHTDHLRQICGRLREAELYAKPSKCQFYKKRMEFLGFVITVDGVEMDPQRVQTIKEWKAYPPKTYRDIQVLLGFCNFYRRFIRDYARLARPLTMLLKGSKNGRKMGDFDKEWGDKQRQAFLRLLGAFEQAPLLRHYDPNAPCRVETDASKYALGAIFSQKKENGLWHPVAFFSKQFKGAELRYGTPDQEMMAIVEAFKHWRHYLEGSRYPIEVLSDHQNLQRFMTQKRLNGRQARWCYYLTPYDFHIVYRTGRTNPADAPSRRPDYMSQAPEQQEGQEDLTLLSTLKAKERNYAQDQCPPRKVSSALLSTQEIKMARVMKIRDPQLRQVIAQGVDVLGQWPTKSPVKNPGYPVRCLIIEDAGRLQECSKEADPLLGIVEAQKVTRRRAKEATQEELPLQDEPSSGLRQLLAAAQGDDPYSRRVLKELATPEGTARAHYSKAADGLLLYKERLYVPQQRSLICELMQLYHDDPLAGHWGVTKTFELLQRKFKWQNMRQDVELYVKTCPTCQGLSAPRHKPYGELSPLPQPAKPWKEISLDWITQLPPSRYKGREYNSILTIVDRYTKMAIFLLAEETMDAVDFAEMFYNEIECRFGPPTGIVSDRDSRITSQFWSDVCYHSIVKRKLSTAFHPQTNGQSEALNRIVEGYLRAFTSLEQMNWAGLLPTATFAYNNSFNHTTKMSPFKAMYGYDPDFHVDVEDNVPGGRTAPAAKDRVRKLHELREALQRQSAQAHAAQARYYDQRHTPVEFSRGSLIKLSTKNLKLADKKLQPRFIGPFRVLEKIGSQAYRIALPEKYSRLHDVFPVQLLERYHPREEAVSKMPLPDLEQDEDEYEVEEVKDRQMIKKSVHYLVKWAGWPSEYNQWIPEGDMLNAQKAITAYERKEKARRDGKEKTTSSKRQSHEEKVGKKRKRK
jgi:hypothetical protein